MNEEALRHAAGCCRKVAQEARRAADRADLVVHRVPAAGLGFRHEADGIRDHAIGMTVASSFLERCARFPEIESALQALERGDTLVPCSDRAVEAVVVGDDEKPALLVRLRAALRERLSLTGRAA